jgi:hypothetical protein
MASAEFRRRLESAGLLHNGAQAATISGLLRQYGAHRSETIERLPDGSVRVALLRDDDETPVCRAPVSLTGQDLTDVSEVIA